MVIEHKSCLTNRIEWWKLSIFCIIAAGFSRVLNVLIQSGANVDSINEFNDTALHFAANNGEFLEFGQSSKFEVNFLSSAIPGHEDVVKLLIRFGANVNAVSKNGYTPLMLAAYNGN